MQNKALLLTTLLTFISCGQSFNSNTNDLFLVESSYCADQSNTALCEANEVIQTKCVSCHTGFHDEWLSYDTDAEWLNSGSSRVIPGNAGASTLITKLKDNGGNMPPSGEELSSEEQQAIRDWINAL